MERWRVEDGWQGEVKKADNVAICTIATLQSET